MADRGVGSGRCGGSGTWPRQPGAGL